MESNKYEPYDSEKCHSKQFEFLIHNLLLRSLNNYAGINFVIQNSYARFELLPITHHLFLGSLKHYAGIKNVIKHCDPFNITIKPVILRKSPQPAPIVEAPPGPRLDWPE